VLMEETWGRVESVHVVQLKCALAQFRSALSFRPSRNEESAL